MASRVCKRLAVLGQHGDGGDAGESAYWVPLQPPKHLSLERQSPLCAQLPIRRDQFDPGKGRQSLTAVLAQDSIHVALGAALTHPHFVDDGDDISLVVARGQ